MAPSRARSEKWLSTRDFFLDRAEDGIRTRDPYLGKVRVFVLWISHIPSSGVRPPSFQYVHPVYRRSRGLYYHQVPEDGVSRLSAVPSTPAWELIGGFTPAPMRREGRGSGISLLSPTDQATTDQFDRCTGSPGVKVVGTVIDTASGPWVDACPQGRQLRAGRANIGAPTDSSRSAGAATG